MDCSPKFGDKFLEETGGLVFIARLLDESQVLVLEGNPFGCKMTVQEVVPADGVLGVV